MPVLPETTQTQKDTHMSWSDSLKNALGGLVGQAEQNLINTYLTKENLAAILAKLEEAGLGAQVKSWLDQTKNNLPITADQVRAALGDQRVQEWAAKFGISPETLSSVLAQVLPQAAAAAGPSVAPPSST